MKDEIILKTYDCCSVNGSIIFGICNFNAIGQYYFSSGKIELIAQIPNELPNAKDLIAQLLIWKENIICVPLNAKNVCIYNRRIQKWTVIPLTYAEQKLKFMYGIIYKNYLYLFPCKYPTIVKINLETKKVFYLKEVMERFYLKNNEIYKPFFRSNIVCMGSILYAACCREDAVLQYDMASDVYQWLSVGVDFKGYAGIVWDGNYFWLAPKENINKIVLWDGKKIKKELILPHSEGIFIRGITIDRDIVLIIKEKSTVCINKRDFNDIQILTQSYVFYKTDEEFSQMFTDEGIYIEKEKEDIKLAKLILPYVAIENFSNGNLKYRDLITGKILEESNRFGLDKYIEVLVKDDGHI